MSNSTTVPTEWLSCARCQDSFERERKRGVKPKHCPHCLGELANEAKAAAAAEEKVQTLKCPACDHTVERAAQRGKPPKCPCGTRFVTVKDTQPRTRPKQYIPALTQEGAEEAVNTVMTQLNAVGQGHYTLARLLKAGKTVPMEEQYKFMYIESQLASGKRDPQDQAALQRVWRQLERSLK